MPSIVCSVLSPIAALKGRLASFAGAALALAVAPSLFADTRTDTLAFTQYANGSATQFVSYEPCLCVGQIPTVADIRGALQFDLSSLGNRIITGAKLKMKVVDPYSGTDTTTFTVSGSTTDTWTKYSGLNLYIPPTPSETIGTFP